MPLRLLMSPSRRRIRIRSATNCNQSHRAGVIGFEHICGETGPVAADLIELAGFRCAMTRIIREYCDQFSFDIMSCQHGNSLVRRPIRNFAEPRPFAIREGSSIHRKARFAETVREMSRPLAGNGFFDDVDKLVRQFFFILSQVSRMVIGNLRKDIRRETSQPRRRVRMRGRNRKVLPRDIVLLSDAFVDRFGHFKRNAAIVDGDQNSVAISLRRDEPCSVRLIRRYRVISCRIAR